MVQLAETCLDLYGKEHLPVARGQLQLLGGEGFPWSNVRRPPGPWNSSQLSRSEDLLRPAPPAPSGVDEAADEDGRTEPSHDNRAMANRRSFAVFDPRFKLCRGPRNGRTQGLTRAGSCRLRTRPGGRPGRRGQWATLRRQRDRAPFPGTGPEASETGEPHPQTRARQLHDASTWAQTARVDDDELPVKVAAPPGHPVARAPGEQAAAAARRPVVDHQRLGGRRWRRRRPRPARKTRPPWPRQEGALDLGGGLEQAPPTRSSSTATTGPGRSGSGCRRRHHRRAGFSVGLTVGQHGAHPSFCCEGVRDELGYHVRCWQ